MLCQPYSATAPRVWMRDLLGMSDDLEGIGQSVWIRQLRAQVGKLRLGLLDWAGIQRVVGSDFITFRQRGRQLRSGINLQH
jgi:hypothetical protein